MCVMYSCTSEFMCVVYVQELVDGKAVDGQDLCVVRMSVCV